MWWNNAPVPRNFSVDRTTVRARLQDEQLVAARNGYLRAQVVIFWSIGEAGRFATDSNWGRDAA